MTTRNSPLPSQESAYRQLYSLSQQRLSTDCSPLEKMELPHRDSSFPHPNVSRRPFRRHAHHPDRSPRNTRRFRRSFFLFMMLPPISRNTDGRNHARKDIYDRKRHKAKEEKSGNPYGQMDHPNLG